MRNKTITIKRIITIFFLVLNITSLMVSSTDVQVDTTDTFGCDNEYYSVTETMNFSQVDINTSYIGFNNTYFNISSSNDIWINISYLDDNIAGLVDGETALIFNATTDSGTVYFNISGFTTNNNYTVNRSGTNIATSLANSSGTIIFNNSVWSEHEFVIVYKAEGGAGPEPPANNPPVISSESPTNNSNGNSVSPTCSVTITDADADFMAVDFYENTTGSWVHQTGYTDVTSGQSKSFTYTNANSYNTGYYWMVTANDTTDNTSEYYYFTTIVNNSPTFNNEYPSDGSMYINISPTLSIEVSDSDDTDLVCDWYTSTDGSTWVWRQTNSTTTGSTIYYVYTGATGYGTRYYWRVTANDTLNNNSATHNFLTLLFAQDNTGSDLLNSTSLMSNPLDTIFSVFTGIIGNAFYLIIIGVIALALYVKTRTLTISSIWIIATCLLLGSGTLFTNAPEMAFVFYLFAGLGFVGLIISMFLMKK